MEFDHYHARPTRSLTGKVAIVTGAGAQGDWGIGNGRASAILLAEDGCTVVCVDVDLALAERTVALIELDKKGSAIALQADVTSAEACERIVQTTLDRYGRLDILVNNVGSGAARGTAEDVDMAEWARGLELNVTSMVLMVKHAIPAMRKNESELGYRGSIVNMSSVAGLRGGTPHLLYPTAKGAIVNMTRAMAAHHSPPHTGVRVNCVCPGMLYTPMMYGRFGMTETIRDARRNRSLLKTEGTGWDAGAAVRFLAGPESRWITGLIMTVDAGVTAAVGTDLPSAASVGGGGVNLVPDPVRFYADS